MIHEVFDPFLHGLIILCSHQNVNLLHVEASQKLLDKNSSLFDCKIKR